MSDSTTDRATATPTDTAGDTATDTASTTATDTSTAPGARSAIEELRARPEADVLIIGGGINGLATFRDLALQGVDVALVERSDFVSGASAASSHMIHGGIRYLENGEFRLVHEAVTERNGLLRIAPHYVRPLRTTIPIYSTFSGVLAAPLKFLRHGGGKPRERGALLIKIGLVIYDSFSRGGGRVPRHAFHGRRRSLRELPQLDPRIRYTATYWDASLHDPERLAIDVLTDGMRAGGDTARAVNYVGAIGASDGAVLLRDELSGEEFAFRAPVVVNASGPWTDVTNAGLGSPTHMMGGTKGSHVVLDHPELFEATGGRELFFEHSDGRIVLIYPLKGRVLVGTTDLEHDMADPIECTEAEVDYFFALIRHVFPRIEVAREQIVYRFSGVRPLPGHGDLAPGFVSRDYRIESAPLPGGAGAGAPDAGAPDAGAPRLLSLVGGKWTTFRASAEHLADRVLDALGRERRTSTKGLAIGGGTDYPDTPRRRLKWIDARVRGAGGGRGASASGVPRERVAELLDRYGTRADDVLAAIAADPADAPLDGAPEYSTAELAHLARTERVVHLDDLLMRRTSLAFTGGVSPRSARAFAEAAAETLGWDADRIDAEVTRGLAAVQAAVPAEARTDFGSAVEPAMAGVGRQHA